MRGLTPYKAFGIKMPVSRQALLSEVHHKMKHRLDDLVQGVSEHEQIAVFLSNHSEHKGAMQQHLASWHTEQSQQLLKVKLSPRLEAEIDAFERWNGNPSTLNAAALLDDLTACESTFLSQAERLAEQFEHYSASMGQRLLLRRWQSHLELCVMTEQLALLDDARAKLLEELYQKLTTQEQLSEVMGESDVKRAQRLWNMVTPRLERQHFSALKQMADLLAHYPKLQQIADELGRQAAMSASRDELGTKQREQRPIDAQMQSLPEEVAGLTIGDELARMVLSETVFLADPDLEVIFFKHLLEKRLLNYQFRGKNVELAETWINCNRTREELLPKGPFILCVDTSGSMSGFAELCAKALCFALMRIALSDERDCKVILFSTDILCYQLTGNDGITEALDFLGYSYKGGTNLAPALSEAVRLMGEEQFENADLVMISDFIAPKLPETLSEAILAQKEHQNRLNAITLSRYGNPQLTELFDNSWNFNPSLGQRWLQRR